MKTRPPRISEFLFKKIFPDHGAYTTLGDLEEVYSRRLEGGEGISSAKRWYRRQLLKSLPHFFITSIYWRTIMVKNYVKISIRNIRRQKAYSFINILGLALGISCAILILLWVQDELSYDRFHEKGDDIFRITNITKQDEGVGTPAPLAPTLVEELPEVLQATRVRRFSRVVLKYRDRAFYEGNIFSVDPSFFSIFSFPFIKGGGAACLTDPLSIIMTEEMALKYFGNEDPINESIIIEGQAELKVTGVLKNTPSNSHIHFDFIIPQKLVEMSRVCGLEWGDFNFYT